jgi:uncharacterized SAM-binding protein YcdF (DUF218 family)
MKKACARAKRVGRVFVAGCAGLLMLQALLLFTPFPWRMYTNLSLSETRLDVNPSWIVVLGGGGIPSESGLMRTYYGARAAKRYPDARVVVALPEDGDVDDSPVGRMRDELVLRGVQADRITLEPRGVNTRAQALEMRRIATNDQARILVVTSPEHIRRAVGTFRKAGFKNADGYPAHDTYEGGDLSVSSDAVQSPLVIQPVEGSLFLRYNVWNNANYLLRASREWVAITYYKLKGWM